MVVHKGHQNEEQFILWYRKDKTQLLNATLSFMH